MFASPKISVVIPTYNAEQFVSRAIDSVLAQSESSFEILICDDCSTDQTRTVVERLSANEPRIRLLPGHHNEGPGAARNRGVNEAKGDWLAFLDADDTMKSDRLQRLASFAETHQLDVVADNYTTFDQSLGVENPPVLTPARSQVPLTARTMILSERPFGWVRLGLLKPVVRREFLNDTQIRYNPNVRYAEDFHFLMRIILEGGRAMLLKEAHYVYTLPSSPVTKRKSGGSRTVPRLRDRIDVADDLIMRYGNLVGAETLADLEMYKRWMVDAYRGLEARELWRQKKYTQAIITAIARPRGVMTYAVTCPTGKRLRRYFHPYGDDMAWAREG